MWDELPSGRAHPRDLRSWGRFITEASAASATFLLSLAVFSFAGLNAIQGSRIILLPPEYLTLYRDGVGEAAVLGVVADVSMVNAASQDYGDVATDVRLSLQPRGEGGSSLEFRMDTIADAIPLGRGQEALAQQQGESCPLGSRCVVNSGLVVIQRPKQLLDVPGGGSRTSSLGFLLVDYLCEGAVKVCKEFGAFPRSLEALKARPDFNVRIRMDFHGDGVKRVECRLQLTARQMEQVFDRLENRGWASLQCARN